MKDFYKIKKIPTVVQVYENLMSAIINGELEPGDHLREVTISKQMGVSRAPVREALVQLEAAGLIEHQIGRGSFVRKLTTNDIIEIYTTRCLLEGYLAQLAAERATKSQILAIKEAALQALEVAKNCNIAETINAEFDIHHKLWQAANHQTIYLILTNLEIQMRMFLAMQAPLFETLLDSVNAHPAIIDAIENRDGTLAKDLTVKHIYDACLRIMKSMGKEELLPDFNLLR